MLNWSASPKKKGRKKQGKGKGKKTRQPSLISGPSSSCLSTLSPWYTNSLIVDAGTFLTLGKQRGELETLWTMGEPEKHCRHIQFQPPGS